MNKSFRMRLKVSKNRNALVALMVLHIVFLATVSRYAHLNVADAAGRGMSSAIPITGSIFSNDAVETNNESSKFLVPDGSLYLSDSARKLLVDAGSGTYTEWEAGSAGGSTDAGLSSFSGARVSEDGDRDAIFEASLQRVLGSGWSTSVVSTSQGVGTGTPNTGLVSLDPGGSGGDKSRLAGIPAFPFAFPWVHTPLSPIDLPPSQEADNPKILFESPLTGEGGASGPGGNAAAPGGSSGPVADPPANSDASPAPEPCSLILLGLGLAGMLSRRIRTGRSVRCAPGG